MGYRVLPDGTIIVDSLEEAIRISKRLRESGGQQHGNTPGVYSLTPTERIRDFVLAIENAGKKGIDSNTLAANLGYDSPRSLPPLLKGFDNRVRQLNPNANPRQIVWFRRRGKEPTLWYAAPDASLEVGVIWEDE